MKPQSAKNRYKHSKSLQEYVEQRLIKHSGYYDCDCWQFSAPSDKDGYKQVHGSPVCRAAGVTRAHQAVYKVYRGEIPDGMFVCHTCDHPWCVNPDHLFLGTPNDNVQDMMRKGRYVHPTERGHFIKVSPERREIIRALKGTMSCFKAAELHDISFSYVCQIWRGER